ncbi:APC family permease, partial [bacterium]|nr:APC family permease [bacterium]
FLIGLAVMASGLTSMATQTRAFTGYFTGMVPAAPAVIVMLGFVGVLTLVNFWGMRESTWLNMFCTMIELGGLVLIIVVGLRFWGSVNYLETPPAADPAAGSGLGTGLLLQGAVLTFYAFIGFEDMINVSEEVKNPRRNFPRAVVIAVVVAAVVYLAVGITAVSVVPFGELAASRQPLVEVVLVAAPWFPAAAFSLIALFAITNTALLNYIMGSRLVYGMARQGFLPGWLGRVHPRRRTPHLAILVLMVLVLILVSAGALAALASATSVLLLCSFIVINASLLVLQRRAGEPPGGFEIPAAIPAGGILVCAALLTRANPRAMAIAFALLAGIALLYVIRRPQAITEQSLTDREGE